MSSLPFYLNQCRVIKVHRMNIDDIHLLEFTEMNSRMNVPSAPGPVRKNSDTSSMGPPTLVKKREAKKEKNKGNGSNGEGASNMETKDKRSSVFGIINHFLPGRQRDQRPLSIGFPSNLGSTSSVTDEEPDISPTNAAIVASLVNPISNPVPIYYIPSLPKLVQAVEWYWADEVHMTGEMDSETIRPFYDDLLIEDKENPSLPKKYSNSIQRKPGIRRISKEQQHRTRSCHDLGMFVPRDHGWISDDEDVKDLIISGYSTPPLPPSTSPPPLDSDDMSITSEENSKEVPEEITSEETSEEIMSKGTSEEEDIEDEDEVRIETSCPIHPNWNQYVNFLLK